MAKNKYLKLYDFKDKDQTITNYEDEILSITNTMIGWDGLPKRADQEELEEDLQEDGFSIMFKHTDGNYYCVKGGLTGNQLDPHRKPTEGLISNPALGLASFRVYFPNHPTHEPTAILIKNDPKMLGLLRPLRRHLTNLAECDLSMNINTVYNTRIQNILSANTDKKALALKKVMDNYRDGEPSILKSSITMDDIKAIDITSASQPLTSLIELRRYLEGQVYASIGLPFNDNGKREAILGNEYSTQIETLAPKFDVMLHCREEACEQMKELWGLDVSVKLHSSWANIQKQHEEEEDYQEEGDMQNGNIEG